MNGPVRPRIRQRPAGADPGRLPSRWHPVLRRVLAARGIGDASELDVALSGLHPPERLGGLDRAAELLADTVTAGARIVVVGDFDADGATGTALAVRALRDMGHDAVDFVVPNRMRHGYGLSAELVEEALRPLAPALVVTVDNGVSSLAGVQAARAAGMRVIVTDHHLPGERLPEADAMVNPNLPGDPFPSKALAGVGVVFYVMAALRGHLRDAGWFGSRPVPAMAELLDLVALGTVADLVPLDRHNRILVSQGLGRMRAGRARPGLAALATVAGRDMRRVTAADLGFALAPRLNAAGRLDDMSVGIECLLCDREDRALALADRLDAINRERRGVQQAMQAQAEAAVADVAHRIGRRDESWAVVLHEPDWHPGVVGLVASRAKDQLHRPVVAFAPASPGSSELKGSARSVRALHLRDALAAVDARHPGLIGRFGGHAMAAGLSLEYSRLEEFRRAFDAEVRSRLDESDLENLIYTDGALGTGDFTLELAGLLRDAAPWGQGFPEPLFDGEFEIREQRVVGGEHLKLALAPVEGGPVIDAMAFRTPGSLIAGASRLRAVYALEANEYRGRTSLQLRVEYLEPV